MVSFKRRNIATLHTEELKGRTCIITGANCGIGEFVAKQLASQGVRVIMACRSLDKAEEAKKQIVAEIGAQAEPLLVPLHLNLAKLDSVPRFVEQFHALGLPLDILLCNAGINTDVSDELQGPESSEDDSKIEKVFHTNVLAHVLLVELLMPDLARTRGNCIITASDVHSLYVSGSESLPVADMAILSRFRKSLKQLGYTGHKAQMETYSYSKLANIWHMFALHQKYHESTGVSFNTVNPSLTASNLIRDIPWYIKWAVKFIIPWIANTTEQGSQCAIHVANLLDRSISGHYYDDCESHNHDRLSAEAQKPARWQELYSFCLDQAKEYLP